MAYRATAVLRSPPGCWRSQWWLWRYSSAAPRPCSRDTSARRWNLQQLTADLMISRMISGDIRWYLVISSDIWSVLHLWSDDWWYREITCEIWWYLSVLTSSWKLPTKILLFWWSGDLTSWWKRCKTITSISDQSWSTPLKNWSEWSAFQGSKSYMINHDVNHDPRWSHISMIGNVSQMCDPKCGDILQCCASDGTWWNSRPSGHGYLP